METKNLKTILIVEDEEIIAYSETFILESYGYAVLVAKTGEDALKLIESNTEIDLILMDIDLGRGMDGRETAQKILSKHDLPLIFLSSHTEREIVEKTEGITSYGYIVKNTGETVMIASIKMAFRLFEAKMNEKEKEKELIKKTEFLQKQEEEYVSILNDLLIGFVLHDKDSSILFCNVKATEILGLSYEQLTGKKAIDPVWKFVHEDMNIMKVEEYPVSVVASTKKPYNDCVLGIIRPDRDSITWVLVNAIPIFSKENVLEKIAVNFIDFTKYKQT